MFIYQEKDKYLHKRKLTKKQIFLRTFILNRHFRKYNNQLYSLPRLDEDVSYRLEFFFILKDKKSTQNLNSQRCVLRLKAKCHPY